MGVLRLGGSMATASVVVRSAGGPVPNVLVELFSVPAEFGRSCRFVTGKSCWS